MRGVGRATAAISLVNAIPTGVGAAVAIDLPVRADIEMDGASGKDGSARLEVVGAMHSLLVQRSFEAAVDRYLGPGAWTGRLSVSSSVPPAVGLKSSSAVSAAVLQSVARAGGHTPAAIEIARLSADLTQAIGLSATGAFDDALACAGGGLVVTDNHARRVLNRTDLDPFLSTIVWIPPGAHEASPTVRSHFERKASEARAAVRAALDGRWFDAMEENSSLVEGVMGYDYSRYRQSLSALGALGTSVSGLGPAMAAIVPTDRTAAVLGWLERLPGRALQVALQPRERGPGGGR